jgi:hypothetical protein
VLIIHSSSGIDYEVVLREIQEVVWLSPSTRHGKARQRYLPGFWVSAGCSAGIFSFIFNGAEKSDSELWKKSPS